MKSLQFLGILLLVSCGNAIPHKQSEFRYLLPDTSKTWSGQMTREAFHQTRDLERKLNLGSLLKGINGEQIRIWNRSSFQDPQSLTILSKTDTNDWILRRLFFDHTKNDSITSDITKPILENISGEDYWNLASQSDMKKGDDYGCMDGGDLFIELADTTKYRFLWYRCPSINENKDSTFRRVMELQRKIAGLVVD